VKVALYRIAQEALHNVVKHAGATAVQVALTHDAGLLTLRITDNGAGFDPTAGFPGHLGLHSMQERADRAGASLRIESAPGTGTTVVVMVGE
jgi:signal transduction histidine kinase